MPDFIFPLPPLQEVVLPNATLPAQVPVVKDLVELLPKDPIQLEQTVTYQWGVVRRKETKVFVTPTMPGEHVFVVEVDDEKGMRHSVRCRITVNPDPKSLWKIIDPPEDAKYRKPHTATIAFDNGGWRPDGVNRHVRIIGASRRGRAHENGGSFRDDDMGFLWNKNMFLLAVADGAGSARFSREGSRLAVKNALASAQESLSKTWPKNLEDVGKALVRAAYSGFESIAKLVDGENKETDSTDKPVEWRDFNTTLLLAAVRRGFFGKTQIVAFSIGDGAIAWCSHSGGKLMCAPDTGTAGGETRFITTPTIWKNASSNWDSFRGRIFTIEVPDREAKTGCLVMMSDGVSDPFFETNEDLSDVDQWKNFLKELPTTPDDFSGSSDPESEANRLLDWLSFYRTGNHDDRTILILRPRTTPWFTTCRASNASENHHAPQQRKS